MTGESIGAEIKAVRMALGLSQVEFAQLLGVTNVSVNRWENGRSTPHANTIDRIRQVRLTGRVSRLPGPAAGVAPDSVLGREAELAQLRQLVSAGTITTLLGPAGAGKSTLARAIALDTAAPQVVWVDLSALEPGGAIVGTIARLLAVRGSATISEADAIRSALESRSLFLVLDTCEHVIAQCAELLRPVDLAIARSSILLTSRIPTGLPSEQIVPVGPLAPEAGVELFLGKAPDIGPNDRALVPELCARLDQIPLALELAAARTAILTIPQILERMDRPFDLLEPMAAAIDSSYALLPAREAALFRALGTLHGSFSIEAVEAIAPGQGAIESLHHLILQSMVQQQTIGGVHSYRLLDSLAAYARARLRELDEESETRERHARYFADVVIQAATGFRSADQIAQLSIVDAVWPNLLPALHWLSTTAQSRLACQMAIAISRYCRRRSIASDALLAVDRTLEACPSDAIPSDLLVERSLLNTLSGNLDRALADADSALALSPDRSARARALDALGLVYRGRSDREAALSAHSEAFRLFQEVGDRPGAASARLNMALIANLAGDLDTAMHGCHEAWALLRGLDDVWGEATVLANLGEIAGRQGKPTEAAGYLERAMERYRLFGDPEREAVIAANTAELHVTLGAFDKAEQRIRPGVAYFREIGNRIQLANALYIQGAVVAALGRQREALEIFRESLDLFYGLDDLMDVAYTLEAIVRIQLERGNLEVALRLWGGMEGLRERERVPDYPLLDVQGLGQMVRAELGDEHARTHLTKGSHLPLATLVGEAMHLGEVTDGPPTLIFRLVTAAPLARPERYRPTERQTEILRLIASGHTNTEIAAELNVSPRTVERHLSTVFGHLGVDRRSAAVAVAAARGFI